MFRNQPQWKIPIELKRRFPELTMICDPSHICGNRELLASVSQKALDLNFEGLMIESHCTPDEAWSDAKQQITPETLKTLLDELVLREMKPENISLTDLDDIRLSIDECDKELIEVLGKRMASVLKIGQYKKQNGMTILQTNRWDGILKTRVDHGEKLNLSEEMIQSIFKSIHLESINKQEKILSGK